MDIGCALVFVTQAFFGQTSCRRWLLFNVGFHAILGQTITIGHGLSNRYKMGMGCSLVWVAHAILGQTITNGHGLLFSLGCSCHLGLYQFK